MNKPHLQIYEFGDFRIDAGKRLLTKGDNELLPLTPKVFDTLLYLVENNGKVIAKDELLREIWADTIVEENNLSQNISILRRILGEKPGEGRFIATVPGRGFRFVPEVRELSEKIPAAADFSAEEKIESEISILKSEIDSHSEPKIKDTKTSRFRFALLAALIIVVIGTTGFFLWRGVNVKSIDTPVKSIAVLPFRPLVAENRDEALEIGMADTLISRLGSNREIVVRPLSSVRRFGNLEQDALSAGRALDVESVLDGSVQRWGDKIRVNVRLIRVTDGTMLWTETFDEKFTDIFVVFGLTESQCRQNCQGENHHQSEDEYLGRVFFHLPFENAARDINAEYLSEGITENLINRLSQLPNIKVMSRSSVFRYQDSEQDVKKIGSELNVKAVLTGSVKQIGDQLVIIVRLDDARNNQQIWGEQYVRRFSDVLTIQNDIVQEVSTHLQIKLTSADEGRIAKRYTNNVEAYQLYLKGQYEWKKHTQEDLQKGIEYFNQALEKDPNYALAYFGLSASYGVLGNQYLPPNEAFPKAKIYAAKALSIDDTLAEAHTATGAVKLYYEWDWAEAEKELKRAQALDPNNAEPHSVDGDYLDAMGRFEESKAERKRAQELDLLSPSYNSNLGITFYFARQNSEAITQFEKAINLEPRNVDAWAYPG